MSREKETPGEEFFFDVYSFTLRQIILENFIQGLKLPFKINTPT